eukprot:CAMPEP_0117052114 /NCGR_PEP_ID=MMETSP0472-20121206/36026_1 /TAXON_ID=693140 ORGANISM="Tiarina fusus, Strain LIS" /NCGR_SAMPLE_ID=MMETSP0472 /ASSEMBLY_ACC=CAM_ASM_000603 /LENGTH=155 /DNA_ID=CAMNT_0004766623 /DNA_START=91 /DNA_END=555 /DNA_ORIENTATION=+
MASTDAPQLSIGLKVLVGFIILHALLLLTQTWAVFDYDTVAGLKLQEPRSMADEAVVQTNRAIGLGDTIIMLPLNIMAIVGILSRKFYGVICSWMLLGAALYWPVVFVMSRFTYASADILHIPLRAEDLITTGAVFFFACWGSWLLCRSPELIEW